MESSKGWVYKKLGDVIELVYGSGLTKNIRQEGKVPVYGSNGIVGYHNEALIKHDTIIVGRKGSVGKIHLVKGYSWPIDTTYYVNILDGSELKFVYYLLIYLNLNKLDQSTAIPGINRNKVYDLEVTIPPLQIQMQIVTKLDQFTKEYEKFKEEKEKAKENYEKILQSAFYKIIENHKPKWISIKDLLENKVILEIKSGFPSGLHTRKGKLVHIRPMNVNLKGEMDFSSCKFVDDALSKNDDYYLQERDVIFNNTNSPELVGKTAVFKSDNKCVYSNHMTRIRVNPQKINPKYLAMYLHNLWRQGYFKMICRSHVSQASINNSMLKEIKIQLPSIKDQDKIIEAIENLEMPVEIINTEANTILLLMQQLTHSVLTKAFQGELIS